MTEASPGASPKRCKNPKNERLPSFPIRLRSRQQLEQLDGMAKAKGKSRNAFVIEKIFEVGDPAGDALPLQDALDQMVLLMVRARVNSREFDVKLPGAIINASITRLKQKGAL